MDQVRAFRFGVQCYRADTGKEWLDKARRCEGLGYSVLAIPDHFIGGAVDVGGALAAAAAVTTSLRLTSFVFANDYRHPAVLAHQAATLDLLSDGRFELGIGAGWMRQEYEAAGLPFDRPGVRLARLAEAVPLLKAFFGDAPVTFAGEHYRVTDLEVTPKPVQRPHPPILVGGGGRRLLELAAREADTVGFAPPALPDGTFDVLGITAAAMDRQVGWVREAAAARFASLELNAYLQACEVTTDVAATVERLAAEFELPAEEITTSPHLLVGSVDGIVETLRERRERYGHSYVTVREDRIDAFAPVVARLAGT